jgi:hypothetical protein
MKGLGWRGGLPSVAYLALLTITLGWSQGSAATAQTCSVVWPVAENIDLFELSTSQQPKRRLSRNEIGRACKLSEEHARLQVRIAQGTFWVWSAQFAAVGSPPMQPLVPPGNPVAGTVAAANPVPPATGSMATGSPSMSPNPRQFTAFMSTAGSINSSAHASFTETRPAAEAPWRVGLPATAEPLNTKSAGAGDDRTKPTEARTAESENVASVSTPPKSQLVSIANTPSLTEQEMSLYSAASIAIANKEELMIARRLRYGQSGGKL